jgi:antitoxin VapB
VSKARIFKSGNSQAVRLPKQFRFHVDQVEILRRGDEIVLREPKRNLGQAFAMLNTGIFAFLFDASCLRAAER